ncbi:MAG: glycosyltransferase family 39 protein [Candidatus Omnitrophota bacterium]|nr:MAG: glycosyltransferase family 39 protein [Candidatus Omnitrophota bacterium]
MGFLIILAMRSLRPKEDRVFLTKIFIAGILVRVLLLTSAHFIYAFLDKWEYYYENMRAIRLFGDSAFTTVRSWWIAQYFSGTPLKDLVFQSTFGDYGHSGYLYIMGLYYYLFGFSPVSVSLINCIASVLTGILFYFMAKEIAGIKQAKIVASLVIFFPSLILWSITNLKDSMFIFFTAVILWAFMQVTIIKKNGYLILLIAAAFLQASFRKYIFIPTIAILGLSYLIMKKKTKYILLVASVLIVTLLVTKFDLREPIYKLIGYHRGVVHSGGFVYRLFDDWIYQRGSPIAELSNLSIIKGLFKGWFHFLLEPFPWKISSTFSILAFPQMIVWYFLLPFSIIGLFFQLRHNWQKSLVFIMYFLSIGSILILTGGNVGTDFRFRDILTSIFILFAGIGICRIFCLEQKGLASGAMEKR